MSTKTAYRTVKIDGYPVHINAVWEGGMYIDLQWSNGNTLEVINVFDYRAGKIKDDVNVSRELTEWLKEQDHDSLQAYYYNT